MIYPVKFHVSRASVVIAQLLAHAGTPFTAFSLQHGLELSIFQLDALHVHGASRIDMGVGEGHLHMSPDTPPTSTAASNAGR